MTARSPRRKLSRFSWSLAAGGTVLMATAVSLGFNDEYGWLYALWFGWIGPIMIILGLTGLFDHRAGR